LHSHSGAWGVSVRVWDRMFRSHGVWEPKKLCDPPTLGSYGRLRTCMGSYVRSHGVWGSCVSEPTTNYHQPQVHTTSMYVMPRMPRMHACHAHDAMRIWLRRYSWYHLFLSYYLQTSTPGRLVRAWGRMFRSHGVREPQLLGDPPTLGNYGRLRTCVGSYVRSHGV